MKQEVSLQLLSKIIWNLVTT